MGEYFVVQTKVVIVAHSIRLPIGSCGVVIERRDRSWREERIWVCFPRPGKCPAFISVAPWNITPVHPLTMSPAQYWQAWKQMQKLYEAEYLLKYPEEEIYETVLCHHDD